MPNAERAHTRTRRKRLDPERRETEIVEGASRYFSEVGFDGSMRDLAARLGISHALLFRYFPTKEALVDRVYERIYLSRWDPAWDAILNDEGVQPVERLVRFYTHYLKAIDRPEWVRTFVYGGLAGVNINQRYLKLIERKVVAPVAVELSRLARPRETRATPSGAALELSWGLHGEIFYLPIRRWVYGMKVTTDLEAFVALTVTKFLEGAPAALRNALSTAAAR
ncbi:TetR/AcrR family transcriptional regulator [Hyphomicrobium sp.]|uniref:TetR/AcrR family transcriptional regulator n=1 Tax=Hyphomicrobium sp. TaxID=82 RepID=UPI0025BDE2FF|nr:TetR/AcrR family transcriptional regulator [Hyphomicrobium sp.]MCC7253666.1 TetR/AcrR family transcriptional regulator [Hyphomicrobium sp.]